LGDEENQENQENQEMSLFQFILQNSIQRKSSHYYNPIAVVTAAAAAMAS